MNLDFNHENYQSVSVHLIPKQSKVFVHLSIVYPNEEMAGTSQELTRRITGLEQFCVKLQVVKGSYEGVYFYHNFNICGGFTKGHQKAIEISKSQIRAFIEAYHMISPKDESEKAVNARKLNSLQDLNGYIFPILVDIETNDKGFLNNKLKSIVTVDDPDYQILLQHGEIIKGNEV